MKPFAKISIISVIVLLIASCANVGQGSPKNNELLSNKWELTNYDGQELANSGIFLAFNAAEKMVYGTAPCNNFFGGFTISDSENNLKFGNAGTTQKFCENTQIEDGFKRDLYQVEKYKIEESKLHLINAGGRTIAVLTAVKVKIQPR